MDSEELSALLGDATAQVKKQANAITKASKVKNGKELEDKILQETDDVVHRSGLAIRTVLEQIEETPQDVDLINAISHMITAHNALMGTLSKHYLSERKYEQQKDLQNIRLSADIKKNTDNNTTKLMMKREDLAAMIEKASIEAKAKASEETKTIIDADVVEDEEELDESWETDEEEADNES